MSDYRIGDEVYIHGFVDEVRKDVVIIKNADEIIPSVTPEQKRGKWNTCYCLKCSECGEIDNRMHWYDNYCPNCGSYNGAI